MNSNYAGRDSRHPSEYKSCSSKSSLLAQAPRQKYLRSCLAAESAREALELLVANELLVDDDDASALRDFEDEDELQAACDVLVKALRDANAELQFDADHFDEYDDFDLLGAGTPAHAEMQWLADYDLVDLFENSDEFNPYVELSLIVGGREVDAARVQPGSQIYAMAGGPNHGQIVKVLSTYYDYDVSTGGHEFLVQKLASFLEETAWPSPYDLGMHDPKVHAFDLPNRAKWPKAAQKEWAALVRGKIVAAVKQLSPLKIALDDINTSASKLIIEVERLGAAVLGKEAIALYRIKELNDDLLEKYDGLIRSVYQGYLALRRVFKRKGVEIPPSSAVRDSIRGLIRRFIRRMGIESLRPRRVEPVTPPMIEKAVKRAQEGTHTTGGIRWDLQEWDCFIVIQWMIANLSIGSRKGESTKLPGDVDGNDWFTRSSVTYRIDGRVVINPTRKQLMSMKEGDLVRLAPKGSKCDQWGTSHGTEPIVLPFHANGLNAARAIRDIELRWACEGDDRQELPLFCDSHGRPFSDQRFGRLVRCALALAVGEQHAKTLSPHSWRVWLATAMRTLGASDAEIQALGRWLNPESIKIYARLGVVEYTGWMDKIMRVRSIDAARTTTLPIMDHHELFEGWQRTLGTKEATAKRPRERDHFDERAAAAAETPSPPVANGTRLSVYWTEMDQWFNGTVASSRRELGDDGHMQRAYRLTYDAVGPWQKKADLSYWHCLDNENWEAIDE